MPTPKTNTGHVKEGYVADVMPERVDGDEAKGLAVPIGLASGGQLGRMTPAEKVELGLYGQAHYDVVDHTVAGQRMVARAAGEAPAIDGGLDVPMEVADNLRLNKQAMPGKRTVGEAAESADFDPLAADPQPGDLEAEERALAQRGRPLAVNARPVAIDQTGRRVDRNTLEAPEARDAFGRRCSVTLNLGIGMMVVKAIDILECQYGLTMLLPLDQEGGTFIPNPGSEISIQRGDKIWNCFFPGVHFSMPEVGVLGLVFIKR